MCRILKVISSDCVNWTQLQQFEKNKIINWQSELDDSSEKISRGLITAIGGKLSLRHIVTLSPAMTIVRVKLQSWFVILKLPTCVYLNYWIIWDDTDLLHKTVFHLVLRKYQVWFCVRILKSLLLIHPYSKFKDQWVLLYQNINSLFTHERKRI